MRDSDDLNAEIFGLLCTATDHHYYTEDEEGWALVTAAKERLRRHIHKTEEGLFTLDADGRVL
jgi:hypothetical protein